MKNDFRRSFLPAFKMASSCPEWYGGGGGSAASGGNSSFGSSGEADILGFCQPIQQQQTHNDDGKNNQQNNDKNWLGGLTGGLGFGGAKDNSNRVSNNSEISPPDAQAVPSTNNHQQQSYASPNTSNTYHHSTSMTAEEYGEVGLDPSAYSTPKPTGSQLGGAAVVGGVAGVVLAGPLVGIAAAGGLAYASTKRGTAGDLCRSTGQAVSDVGQEVKEFNEDHKITEQAWSGLQTGVQSVQQFEQQHRWGEQTKNAAGTAWSSARDLEQEHELGDKTKRGLGQAWQSARQFDRDNKVSENIGKGIMASGRWIGGVITGGNDKPNDKGSGGRGNDSAGGGNGGWD